MPIRLLLADDSESIRKWYAYVFSQEKEIDLLPMASTGYEAISFAAMYHPDVIILDMEMENRDSGLIAGQQILAMNPEAKIIMLTIYDDDATIFRTYEMGAIDYLFKDAPFEDVIEAVRNAYHDTTPIRQEIAKRMRSEFRRLKENENSLLELLKIVRQLSSAESNIVIMLANGMSRQEICQERCIEMSTLKTHIRMILRKMNVSNTRELVTLVKKKKLLEYIRNSDEGTGSAQIADIT